MSALVEKAASPSKTTIPYVVLTGNPNCGKTTVFNALTGLRARVGNYAGVTVERKEGRLQKTPGDREIVVLDLPGTYSLSPQSLDERISRDVLLRRLPEVPAPSVVVVVIDASNLERNLYYATQVLELGYRVILALNMVDVAEQNGHNVDAQALSRELQVPVIPLVASEGKGISELREAVLKGIDEPVPPRRRSLFCEVPNAFRRELNRVTDALSEVKSVPEEFRASEGLLLLSDDKVFSAPEMGYPNSLREIVKESRGRLEAAGIDWRGAAIEGRYALIGALKENVLRVEDTFEETFSDRLDRIVTHRFWGMLIFVAIMGVMFFTIFSFAKLPMDLLQGAVSWAGGWVGGLLPEGPLQSLLVNGVVKGVGAVVVFLPQICLLFLFIGLLEDTGYMARAAFLMDRLMSKVGLHGKSFIPMLSSFACAIPGIMATRTIETPKDRLVTILVAPLMSCSARLPVYTLLIAASFPDRRLLAAGVMLAMYLLGIVVALLMAWFFKKTLLKGAAPLLIMELPPYKRPLLRVVSRHMWDRSKLFLRRAGTVILGINIILWFLATYPKDPKIAERFAAARSSIPKTEEAAAKEKRAALDNEEAGEKLRHSFAGRLGQWIEPAIAPLGFDWKIGIGIVSSFAAREVFVSTMSIVYNVGENEDEEAAQKSLVETLHQQKRPDGTLVYTALTCVTLMVFYVLALQCVSTVAVVRRETNSWKWPVIQWVYMGLLAWVFAFITFQGGRLLGF
jgi:ferrous iron transport protein B